MRRALAGSSRHHRRSLLTGFACETVASSNCCLLHSAGKAGRGRTEAAASKWPCVAPCSLQSHTGFQHALRGRAAGVRGRMMSLELGRAPDPDRQPAPRRAAPRLPPPPSCASRATRNAWRPSAAVATNGRVCSWKNENQFPRVHSCDKRASVAASKLINCRDFILDKSRLLISRTCIFSFFITNNAFYIFGSQYCSILKG